MGVLQQLEQEVLPGARGCAVRGDHGGGQERASLTWTGRWPPSTRHRQDARVAHAPFVVSAHRCGLTRARGKQPPSDKEGVVRSLEARNRPQSPHPHIATPWAFDSARRRPAPAPQPPRPREKGPVPHPCAQQAAAAARRRATWSHGADSEARPSASWEECGVSGGHRCRRLPTRLGIRPPFFPLGRCNHDIFSCALEADELQNVHVIVSDL